MIPALSGEPAERFVLGDAPFWPVDRLVVPDAWAGHIPFAFWIVEALRPRVLVELGTHSGNSYLAFAQAVHRLGLGTACFAVDSWRGDAHAGYYGEEVFRELSAYHDARYSAFSRLVRSTFDEALQHFADASVDLLHVDGYHTYEAVACDFETWGPKLSARAVVLFHDTNVREGDFGVWRLWRELRGGYPHFEFLHAHGLGVLGVGSDLPAAVTALLQTPRGATGVSRIRDAFARLGSAMHFQARGEALQTETDRLGEALRRAGQEVAARDELIRRGADERTAIEEAARVRDQARVAENEEQRGLIKGLQHENEEQRGLIKGLQHENEEQRGLIKGLQHKNEEQRGLIKGLQHKNEEQRGLIKGLQHKNEEQRGLIKGLQQENEEQRGLISGLQHEIVRLGKVRETDLAGLQEQLHRAERARGEVSAETETLRAALSALHQSRSLRLTRPLRQAGGWYRAAVTWAGRGARSP